MAKAAFKTVLPTAAAQHVSLLPQRLRLTFGVPCAIKGNIDVLVRGILLSSTQVAGKFEAGQHIDLPVNYFPNVQLPGQLRICFGDEEIAPPLAIKSPEDVMALVGQGEIKAENLSLEAGLLRGSLVLRGNAASIPHAYIRLNGVVIRSVVVEPPAARDTGGAACRFAVPIRPADFVESGLNIDLHVSGIDYPLANFSYTRNDPAADGQRLLKLEEEMRQLQRSASAQVEMLNANFQRRLTLQQERVDAFIEYATSIVLDHFANAFETKSDPMTFLRALTEARSQTVSGETAQIQSQAIHNAEARVDSNLFAFGWYDLERNDSGPFRWMGQTALVNNPYPNLPISRMDFLITHVYGAAEPLLRVTADDVEFNVTTSKFGGHYLVTFSAPQGAQEIYAQSIRVESFNSGCPATDEGTTDTRILSVAAEKVDFHYRPAKVRAESHA
ncbi:hypothetical protein [Acidocella aromatica]|uniref:Uncharacterized protein n=1 Tax=Acidocella aromatica TaxID=1303579 RepID=A0A840VHU0_9PROT|nr:hypothetical protein [Acidocella aromatica]MBB5372755.1 hypothetical protein [Acidocella aromatica]